MTFAKILFLVFVFQNLECFQASNSYANLTLINAIEHFNEQLVDTIVREFNLDPNGKLHEILPVARTIVNASLTRLAECYDNTVGDEELDIFHEPLGVIVHKFFTNFFRRLLENKSLEEAKNRIKALLDSVQYIGKRVIKCALNLDPDYKPTKLGLTPLSAYTKEDFSRILRPRTPQVNEPKPGEIKLGATRIHAPFPSCKVEKISSEVYDKDKLDWREKGVVTPAQFQSYCGACYVFTAVGALESAYMLAGPWNTSDQVKFSEKSFLDCTEKGCFGGLATDVWERAIHYGVTLDEDAPEFNMKKDECRNDKIFSKSTGYCMERELNNENELKAIVANYGPATIAIWASHPDFAHLRGKWEQNCHEQQYADNINHGVLAVGWDEDYWIIKNSWSQDWGVDGFLYLAKSAAVNCGVLYEAGVPFFEPHTESYKKSNKTREYTHKKEPPMHLTLTINGHEVDAANSDIVKFDPNTNTYIINA